VYYPQPNKPAGIGYDYQYLVYQPGNCIELRVFADPDDIYIHELSFALDRSLNTTGIMTAVINPEYLLASGIFS
jgi:hypothetical protein